MTSQLCPVRGQDATLALAAERGRVTALTASAASIAALARHGLLTPGELAGTWVPTVNGLCTAGRCPF